VFLSVCLGGVIVVEGLMTEAAMEEADEAVGVWRARRFGLNRAHGLLIDEQQIVGATVPGGHDELLYPMPCAAYRFIAERPAPSNHTPATDGRSTQARASAVRYAPSLTRWDSGPRATDDQRTACPSGESPHSTPLAIPSMSKGHHTRQTVTGSAGQSVLPRANNPI
jgi:hypothetical protein